MFMPQNDHDYHNINAMHVHTKNDQDFDSAIHYRNKRITKRIGFLVVEVGNHIYEGLSI